MGYGICPPPIHAKTIVTHSCVIVRPTSICDVYGFHPALPTPYSTAYQQDSDRYAIDALLLVPYSIVLGARYLIISWLDRKLGLFDLGHLLDFLNLCSPLIFNSSTNPGEISILIRVMFKCRHGNEVRNHSPIMASDQ